MQICKFCFCTNFSLGGKHAKQALLLLWSIFPFGVSWLVPLAAACVSRSIHPRLSILIMDEQNRMQNKTRDQVKWPVCIWSRAPLAPSILDNPLKTVYYSHTQSEKVAEEIPEEFSPFSVVLANGQVKSIHLYSHYSSCCCWQLWM